jgi:hypothetical protein
VTTLWGDPELPAIAAFVVIDRGGSPPRKRRLAAGSRPPLNQFDFSTGLAQAAQQRELFAATSIATSDVASEMGGLLIHCRVIAALRQGDQVINARRAWMGMPIFLADALSTDMASPAVTVKDLLISDSVP